MPLISSDLQATVTLATDIAIVISLVVVATQVYLQRKATKYNTYEKLMSDFSANASLLIDRPEILEIYFRGNGKPKRWDKYSEAEKKAFSFFSSTLALLERVWFGVPERDWIDYYSKWVKDLATNGVFLDVFNDNKKMYDVSFTGEIDAIIKEVKEKS
ncbi:MAG: hypothetical protein ABSD92_12635 [Candidatus Bathyarchaeia archaeon]|jgi:hypothetical protein